MSSRKPEETFVYLCVRRYIKVVKQSTTLQKMSWKLTCFGGISESYICAHVHHAHRLCQHGSDCVHLSILHSMYQAVRLRCGYVGVIRPSFPWLTGSLPSVWSQLLFEEPIYYCLPGHGVVFEEFQAILEITTKTLSLPNRKGTMTHLTQHPACFQCCLTQFSFLGWISSVTLCVLPLNLDANILLPHVKISCAFIKSTTAHIVACFKRLDFYCFW